MPAVAAKVARTTRADIEEFLAHRRIAAVGLSRDPKDFTRTLIAEFEKRGYEVVPVNPAVAEIGGNVCFPRVEDIVPPVCAALVLTPATKTDEVVRDCAAAGVTHVWMYGTSGAGGQGAVSATAVDFCREHGIKVVAGECPFMFLPGTGFLPHQLHGLIRKIVGSYPR
jgi:predicted CoA-binding protein